LTDQNPIQVIVDAIINRYVLIFRSCTHVWKLQFDDESLSFFSLHCVTAQESEVVLLNRLLKWQQCVVVLVCLELTSLEFGLANTFLLCAVVLVKMQPVLDLQVLSEDKLWISHPWEGWIKLFICSPLEHERVLLGMWRQLLSA
jgi:hypothetical protein